MNEQRYERMWVEDVPVDRTFWPEEYGRKLYRKKADAFDGNATDVKVSLRSDGRFAVIDGNHTVTHAREAGIKTIAALVYFNLTIEQEADLYLKFNNQVRQSPLDKFKARLAMGDATAAAIREILVSVGLDVAITGCRIGRIQAVSVMESVYRDVGADVLRRIVAIIKHAYDAEPKAYTGEFVKGLAQFWIRYAKLSLFSEARLRKVLSETSIERIRQASDAYKVGGGTTSIAVGKAILKLYNYRLREESQLPEWPTKAYSDNAKAKRQTARDSKRVSAAAVALPNQTALLH